MKFVKFLINSQGGWRPKHDSALDPHYGASLFEGARGGIACTERGAGGFGGGIKKSNFLLF